MDVTLEQLLAIQTKRSTHTDPGLPAVKIAIAYFEGKVAPFQIVKGMKIEGKNPDGKVLAMMSRTLKNAVVAGKVKLMVVEG